MTTDPVPVLLGVAWAGLLVAAALTRLRAVPIRERVGNLAPDVRPPARPRAPGFGMVGRVVRGLAARPARRRVAARVEAELPVLVDLLALAMGAGATPQLAVEAVAPWAPPALAQPVQLVVRACRLGTPFTGALDEAIVAAPALAPVVDALAVSDRLGAPVLPALERLALALRADARRRAEARARTVPVRLLFPLVLLVLPAFGLLTVAPALLGALRR